MFSKLGLFCTKVGDLSRVFDRNRSWASQDFAVGGCDSGCVVYCGALNLEPAKAASVRKTAKSAYPPHKRPVNGGQVGGYFNIVLSKSQRKRAENGLRKSPLSLS